MKERSGQILKDFCKSQIFNKILSAKKSKIVATIGPASDSPEILNQLINNGLNIFRLNMSHGTLESHYNTIVQIKKSVRASARQFGLPTIIDLKGPSIRTGRNLGGHPISLIAGQLLKISTSGSLLGQKDMIACDYPQLLTSVGLGDRILVGDGNLTLIVKKIVESENYLITEVLNNYLLRERKNMNLPGNRVELETITENDKFILENFAIPSDVDFVSVSFCRSAADLKTCREVLGLKGRDIRLIAKIENHEGINNLEEIMQEADGIMIARGDLGMEIPPERITIAQKLMTQFCRKNLKPVINATQMLESMTVNARPTRAEISDVTNAVLDGNDCVMLSGETSAGNFPSKAVSIMNDISLQAESCIDYRSTFFNKSFVSKSPKEALVYSTVASSLSSNSSLIIMIGEEIELAKLCSMLRPNAIVLATVKTDKDAKYLELFSGLHGVIVDSNEENSCKIGRCIEKAKTLKIIDNNFKASTIVMNSKNMSLQKLP